MDNNGRQIEILSRDNSRLLSKGKTSISSLQYCYPLQDRLSHPHSIIGTPSPSAAPLQLNLAPDCPIGPTSPCGEAITRQFVRPTEHPAGNCTQTIRINSLSWNWNKLFVLELEYSLSWN